MWVGAGGGGGSGHPAQVFWLLMIQKLLRQVYFSACLTLNVSCKHLLIVSSTDHLELAAGDCDQVAILANLAQENNSGKI